MVRNMLFFSLNLINGLRAIQGFSFSRRPVKGHELPQRIAWSFRSRSVTSSKLNAVNDQPISKPVPMTLLAGFLGTGKTSTLKHLLENKEKLKIGVIVNDVASVNIDAKLVSGQGGGMVELQNGCACCSLADELFFSVEKLVQNRDFDALVVELSGVADPMAIRNNWKMAPIELRQMAEVKKVVTVIDSQTFGTDYMTWDVVEDRKGWSDFSDPCGGNQKVSELLAEQVEAADLIMINKIDLATNEQVEIASKVAKALNEKADMRRVEFGKISPKELLRFVSSEVDNLKSDYDSEHAHSHDHQNICSDPMCADQSHSHSHSHEHSHACDDPSCTDPSHSGSGQNESTICSDPDCTDSTHSHSHEHSHATSTDNLGIGNFVYKATKPFSTQRLLNVLNRWPIPKKDVLDMKFLEQPLEYSGPSLESDPFVGVLRSKGFCWFAPNQWEGSTDDSWRHDTAMYMSHAGRHMSITGAGKWWASVPRHSLQKYFDDDNKSELDRILREDFVSEEFGDRRQELVFIGVDINESAIRQTLDDCLLTEEEMQIYRKQLDKLQTKTIGTTSSSII